MRFVETQVFTDCLLENFSDEEYRSLQFALLLRPRLGPIIRGSGGLRKARWGTRGRGKRGGVRVIYYWNEPSNTIYLLFLYRKVDQDDLTPTQRKTLGRLVREELA